MSNLEEYQAIQPVLFLAASLVVEVAVLEADDDEVDDLARRRRRKRCAIVARME